MWLALILFACGSPRTTPVPEPDPVPAPAPAPAPADPAGVLDAWAPFFADRFGEQPDAHVVADLDGDGRRDLIVHVWGSWLAFRDLSASPPTTWDTVLRDPQATPRVLDAGAARALVDDVPIQDGQDVLAFGDPAPFLVFWWGKTGELAWLPSVPPTLADAEAAARTAHPDAFGISPNNRLGEGGFDGESPLTQAFAGDFDGDGAVELVVWDDGTVVRWAGGEPTSQTVDYPARRGMVVRGGSTIHPFPSDDGDATPVEVSSDYLALSVPESSSVALHLKDGTWTEVWTGD